MKKTCFIVYSRLPFLKEEVNCSKINSFHKSVSKKMYGLSNDRTVLTDFTHWYSWYCQVRTMGLVWESIHIGDMSERKCNTVVVLR